MWKDFAVTSSCSKHNKDGALDPIMPTTKIRDKYTFKETSGRTALFLKCEEPTVNSLGKMEISPVVQVLFPCNDSCGELSQILNLKIIQYSILYSEQPRFSRQEDLPRGCEGPGVGAETRFAD